MTDLASPAAAQDDSPPLTVLSGATVITMDGARRVLTDGAVAFTDVLLAVGSTAEVLAAHPDADVIDCSGRVVLPGFVNTHTHLFQTLLKGLGDDRVLSDWFRDHDRPVGGRLTPGGLLRRSAARLRRGIDHGDDDAASTSCTCTRGPASATLWQRRCSMSASAGSWHGVT